MTSKPSNAVRPFGRRSEPHRITISKSGRSRSYTVRPWLAGSALTVIAAITAGYLGATGYLVYRDQFLSENQIRQIAIQQDYEARIAALRDEIDRINSRQIVGRELVEAKLDRLLDRKASLDERHELLDELLDQARQAGVNPPVVGPVPEPKPMRKSDALGAIEDAVDPIITGTIETDNGGKLALASIGLRLTDAAFLGETAAPPPVAETAVALNEPNASDTDEFDRISHDFGVLEERQSNTLALLASKTEQKATQISRLLGGLGYDAEQLARTSGEDTEAVGGPYIPAIDVTALPFEQRVEAIQRLIERLNALRSGLDLVPLAKPIRGDAHMTSRYGVRLDPFLRSPAMHAGIDFKASYGHPVIATADGVVVRAGRAGGYGKMVEIDHGHGVTTRYAHLSSIAVAEGDKIHVGQKIGKLGSTGRSTGPHLHYETRVNGSAVNPLKFLEAGRRIQASL